MEHQYQERWDEHMMRQTFVGERTNVMKGRKRKRNPLYRSKIKRFAKVRDLKKKLQHTLPQKILHLQNFIFIESPIEISQFAFIEFPESQGYTAEGLLFQERSQATLF